MLRLVSRSFARMKVAGPPGLSAVPDGKKTKEARAAKSEAKRLRREEEMAERKARKAGAQGRVVATFSDVSKYLPDGRQLFTKFSAQIKNKARIGVIGVNGSGKSSLLKIIAGQDREFTGEVNVPSDISVGFLTQEPHLTDSLTVDEAIQGGVARIKSLKDRFHELIDLVSSTKDDDQRAALLAELDDVRERIDRTGRDNWILDARVKLAMEALRCPPGDRIVGTLSGGEKRRVALAMVLLSKPDLLLLDEPTNHLDAQSVEWLEEYLKRYQGTVVTVTHDRYFLDKVANWILEVDKGSLLPFHGNYSKWLETKERRSEMEAKQDEKRSKTLKDELEWIRSKAGQKAVIQQSRLKSYDELLAASKKQRLEPGRIVIPPGPPLKQKVIALRGVSKSLNGRLLIDNLSLDIPRGAIVGITGPNGAGKTTLFKMLLGLETPDAGEVEIGESVRFGHVAQTREALSDDVSVYQALTGAGAGGPTSQDKAKHLQELAALQKKEQEQRAKQAGPRDPAASAGATSAVAAAIKAAATPTPLLGDKISLGDGREIASRAYLALFGFKGGSQDKTVRDLSGGERNRLHLAKMLSGGSNVLLLDEPTNDLDVDTLRSLEDSLPGFVGCALIISHDRWFLDRTVTHILHFEGKDGKVELFEGNWLTYEKDRRARGLGVEYVDDEEAFRTFSFSN